MYHTQLLSTIAAVSNSECISVPIVNHLNISTSKPPLTLINPDNQYSTVF